MRPNSARSLGDEKSPGLKVPEERESEAATAVLFFSFPRAFDSAGAGEPDKYCVPPRLLAVSVCGVLQETRAALKPIATS